MLILVDLLSFEKKGVQKVKNVIPMKMGIFKKNCTTVTYEISDQVGDDSIRLFGQHLITYKRKIK